MVFFPLIAVERKDDGFAGTAGQGDLRQLPGPRTMPRLRTDDPGAPRHLGRPERGGAAGPSRASVRHGVTATDGCPPRRSADLDAATAAVAATTRQPAAAGSANPDRSCGSARGSRTARRTTASSARACRWSCCTAGRSATTPTAAVAPPPGRAGLPGHRAGAARLRRHTRPARERRSTSPATRPGWTSSSSAVGIDEKVGDRRPLVRRRGGHPLSPTTTPSGSARWCSSTRSAARPGSGARSLTSIAERPLWDWGLHFPPTCGPSARPPGCSR